MEPWFEPEFEDDPTVYGRMADLLDPPPSPSARYLADPVAWVRERTGGFPWSRQRMILESVRDNPRTAVHSCHSTGKSWTAAEAVAWWLDVHPEGTAMAVTTAPTGAQVKGILWRYITALHASCGLPGRTNQTEWYIGDQLVALGRKPSDHSPTAFSGYHALHMLVVIDEGSGVTAEIFDALSTLVAGGHGRMLVIGNPDQPVGPFAAACRDGSGWNTIHIGAEDTPAYTGEDVPSEVLGSLITRDWVEDRKRAWGVDSALYQSKVLGVFPRQGSQWAVVQHDAATRCRYLDLPTRADDVIEAGLDFGAGGDRTVLRERRGMKAGRRLEFRSADPMQSCGLIMQALVDWGVTRVKADSIGIGWAMVGRLKELAPAGMEIVGVNFSHSPTVENKARFGNLRAEVWWTIGRELSASGAWDLGECDDDVINELTAPEYRIVDSAGKVMVEPKADVRKRLGVSPDDADALLLAFWSPSWQAALPSLPDAWGASLLPGTSR